MIGISPLSHQLYMSQHEMFGAYVLPPTPIEDGGGLHKGIPHIIGEHVSCYRGV